MYYPIINIRVTKTHRKRIAFLFLFVSLITFQTKSNAEMLELTAKQYRLEGYESQRRGDYNKALIDYAKAIELGFKDASIFNDIGVVYEQLGVYDRAEMFYLKAIRIDENYLPPLTNLAYFYKAGGKADKAIEYFSKRYQKAPEGDPWRERAKEELFELDPRYKQRIIKREAEELNKKLVDEAHKRFYLKVMRAEKHCEMAKELLDQKKFDDALVELDRALVFTPDNPLIEELREVVLYEERIEDIKRRADSAIKKLDEGNLESAKEEFQYILATIPEEASQKSE